MSCPTVQQPQHVIVSILRDRKAGPGIIPGLLSFFNEKELNTLVQTLLYRGNDDKVRSMITNEERLWSRVPRAIDVENIKKLAAKYGPGFTTKHLAQINMRGLMYPREYLGETLAANNEKGEKISRFPNAISLDLQGTSNMTPDSLAYLKYTPNLSSLNLNKVNTYEIPSADHYPVQGLVHLRYVKGLKELGLHSWSFLRDQDIENIVKACPNLQRLDLSGCKDLTDAAFEWLAQLKDLEYLDISHCKVTDTALSILAENPNLRHLNVRQCAEITNVGLKAITKHKKLRFLDIARCNGISDLADLASGLSMLETLSIDECNHLQNLDCLGKLTRLRELSADLCPSICQALPNCTPFWKDLTHLDLSRCNLKDITPLLLLPQLQELTLQNIESASQLLLREHLPNNPGYEREDLPPPVTRDGLIALLKLKHLAFLNVCWDKAGPDRNVWNLSLQDISKISPSLERISWHTVRTGHGGRRIVWHNIPRNIPQDQDDFKSLEFELDLPPRHHPDRMEEEKS